MDGFQAGVQYRQDQLPSEVFNRGHGDTFKQGGKSYRVINNGNGTRSFESFVDTSAYDNLLGSLPKSQDIAKTVTDTENQAFDSYFNYITSQETPLDFYGRMSEEQGIPQMRQVQKTLQGQIYDLEDSLRRIEPDVEATTRNSVVTEAQRRGMVQEKAKPMIENLGWLGQSAGRVASAITDANQIVLTLTQLNEQGQQKVIDAFKTKLELVSKQGDRAIQTFINDTDKLLQVTLAKIARQEAVDDREANFAHRLLEIQQQAKYQMEQLKFQADQSATEVVEVGGRKLLIDKRTGQTVKDLGASGSGSGSGIGSLSTTPTPAPAFKPAANKPVDNSKYLTPTSGSSASLSQPINGPSAWDTFMGWLGATPKEYEQDAFAQSISNINTPINLQR